MSCAEVRTALGVYIVGAIEPAERSRLEAHLAGCPICRDELASMAGLPALLGRVSEEQIEHVAGRPDELLESLLARAAATPPLAHRRRLPWAPLAIAAAVLVVAGFLLGGLLVSASGGRGGVALPTPSAPPSASSSQTADVAEQAAATDPRTHISAHLSLVPEEWGTALTVSIDGAKPGWRCKMIVLARDGRQDVAGSWQVAPETYEKYVYAGSTAIPRSAMRSVRILSSDGKTLVTVPL